MELIILSAATALLLLSILVYLNIGIKGKLRKYCRKNKLNKMGEKVKVAPEVLRQDFLLDYPKYRNYSTYDFINYMKYIITYIGDSDEFEDGYFLVSAKSKYSGRPKPTDKIPELPENFIDIQ